MAASALQRLAALRGDGGERFDPLRFAFIGALARRAAAREGAARRRLEARLACALDEFEAAFSQARGEARRRLDEMAARHPGAMALDDVAASGDFAALHRAVGRVARRRPSLLAALQPSVAPRSPDAAAAASLPPARDGLKSADVFRADWVRLEIEQQLAAALAGRPDNAGPLNSHWLILQAMSRMHALSPAYLGCFIAHADTLLLLDRLRPSRRRERPVRDLP